jgi:hypothetical protein
VLGNLPAHKRDDAKRAVEKRGAWLLFLPPYSPYFNPIELAFSKFKAHMTRLKPRTSDDLWKAARKVCELFKPEECMNFFIADGYAPETPGNVLDANTFHECRHGLTDLVGAVFLHEMGALDGDFRLVWPTTAEFALRAGQDRPRIGIDEQFRQIAL